MVKPLVAAYAVVFALGVEANCVARTSNSTMTATSGAPTVSLVQGTFRGNTTTSAGYTIEYFKGIRFTQPLDASWRFKKPAAVTQGNTTAVQDATSSGATCADADDCLFLDIYRPQGVKQGDKVPVVVWTHGGGFTQGSPGQYPGTSMAAASTRLGKPVIHISLSYRYGGFGFMAGQDILDSVANNDADLNVGLYDQRQAYRWIQDNIEEFGGDSDHVVLWGQSAGAQGVGSQLVANGGSTEGLFHAAIIQSGGPMAGVFLEADHDRLTTTFRNVSSWSGCGNATNQVACLRAVDFATISGAISTSENVGAVAGNNVYSPVVYANDYFFPERPRALIANGKVADVPILAGSVHDEGGFFGFMFESQVQTAEEFTTWFSTQALIDSQNENATAVMDKIFDLYPDEPAIGCPYPSNYTSTSGGFTNTTFRWYEPYNSNQYKRAVSVWSDWNFVAPRRWLMQNLVKQQRQSPLYGYLFAHIAQSANQSTESEAAGAAHTYDLPFLFCTWGEECSQEGSASLEDDYTLYNLMQSAWVGFINSYDPNSILDASWPQYGNNGLLQSLKGSDYNRTVTDDYRAGQIDYLISDEAAPVLAY